MAFQDIINALSLGGVYATIAVGYALIFGVLKFTNFSHGYSMMVCAYIGFFITSFLHTNFWVTLFLAATAGGTIGMLIEYFGFRHLRRKKSSTLLFFVSSMTIGMMLEAVIYLLFPVSIFAYPKFFKQSFIKIGTITFIINDSLMLIITVIMFVIIAFVLFKTRLGISIRALSMDATTASLMGINVSLVISVTFFVAYAIAGMSGMFLGMSQTISPMISRIMSKATVAAVLGGLGSIGGAILGSIIVALIEVILIKIPFIGSGLTPVVLFFLMILFLVVRPQGISGRFTKEKV
jgi:branched-chain amino acid transport system permease protein